MRRYVVLTAVAAAVVAIVVLPSIGSAAGTGQTLTLMSTQDSSFFPNHKGGPRPGDRFGFTDRETGGDTGRSYATCTVVGKGGGVCVVMVNLTKGQIAGQFSIALATNGPPKHAIITGGTGAYNAAGGTVDLKALSQNKTQLTFHFV